MTFTYDLAAEDAAEKNIARVRLELGDTIQNAGVRPDGSNLTDEELAVWLADEDDDIMNTVARACSALSNMWTNVANLTVGPRREELGQIAQGWADRAAQALPSLGASYQVNVIPVDQRQDPYAVRPEDEMGM